VSLGGLSFGPKSASDLLARLRGLLPRPLSNAPLLSRSAEPAEELVLAKHGAVAIRQTVTGWSLETCVKGEPEQARATAMRRLANYAAGKNSRYGRLGTVRPLVQAEEARGRWRVRIGIADADTDVALTSARNGRVRVCIAEATTLAVMRVPGRPTLLAMQHAETAIRHAIAATRWEVVGTTMLRLNGLPNVLPFRGSFEVAVPVAEHPLRSAGSGSSRAVPLREAATAASPPVH
jgi:hypothetical protein